MATLQWNLSGTTGYDFVDHILERVPWGRENLHIRQHALTLVSVCQTGTLIMLFSIRKLSFTLCYQQRNIQYFIIITVWFLNI